MLCMWVWSTATIYCFYYANTHIFRPYQNDGVCVRVCVCFYVDILVSKLYISFVYWNIYKVAHTYISSVRRTIFLCRSSAVYSSLLEFTSEPFCTCPKPSCNVQVNVKPSSTSLYLGWLEIRYNIEYTHISTYQVLLYLPQASNFSPSQTYISNSAHSYVIIQAKIHYVLFGFSTGFFVFYKQVKRNTPCYP